MPSRPHPARPTRSQAYRLTTLVLGLVVAGCAAAGVRDGGVDGRLGWALALGVPLIALIARFPMVLDGDAGGIEVGFESCVLMFLVCTLDASPALLVWSGGVLLTQALAGKAPLARGFNIGLGIAAGGLATIVYAGLNGGLSVETPRALLAVALAAASYFLTDYLLSAVAVTLASDATLRSVLGRPGTMLALACFVPLDSLGYLAAVVHRSAPWWTLLLLVVPLATVLIAARAVTRGRENARRLTVLFGAAGRAQTLADRQEVRTALCADARELLRLRDVELRSSAPCDGEIGVQVQLGQERTWLIARAAQRARATAASDEEALRALAAVASDASARIELVDEMVHVARHDPLTDLPNRGILLDRTNEALQRGRAVGARTALLFLDLDGFKPVNDRFGHQAGDLVLVEIAGRLREAVRDGDTVARLGGDEFAVLIEDAEPAVGAEMCERILAAVGQGAVVGGVPVRLGASIGIAYDSGTGGAGALLRNADLAMYEAKSAGKGRCVVFEPAVGHARVERLELLDDLRGAVEGEEIDVVYQPVVEAESGRIVGFESLARWTRGGVPVSPELFIGIAEESGLIVKLGAAVLRRVSRDAAAIGEGGGKGRVVAVNISAAQLREPDFVATVMRAKEALSDMHLVLEITERQGIDLTGEVLEMMRTIADMGVHFSIDDFGAGFSSISYLKDLPASVIKADAALARNIDGDQRARALLRSVAEMGRTMGFRVIVEGIERQSQLDVVRADAPYAMVQGYLLHRPMPCERLIEVLAEEPPAEGLLVP